MFDYSKLKGKIKEVFGTQSAFAKAMGLSGVSLSSKLNNITGSVDLLSPVPGEVADFI